MLEGKVCCTKQASLVPQNRPFDSRRRSRKGKRPPPDLGQHGRFKKIPCCEHTATEQIQREVENVDEIRQGNAERPSHALETTLSPFVTTDRELIYVLRADMLA